MLGASVPPSPRDYPALVYRGRVHLPIFPVFPNGKPKFDPKCVSDDAPKRQAYFEHARVNFAGTWVLETCSCGSGCSYLYMWNARTGELYRNFPFRGIQLGLNTANWRGLVFTPASRLLITEARIDDPRARPNQRCYYLWTGKRFVLLFQHPLPRR